MLKHMHLTVSRSFPDYYYYDYRCYSYQFECDNGNCIDDNYECDGSNDCGDNSDEEDCFESGSMFISYCYRYISGP